MSPHTDTTLANPAATKPIWDDILAVLRELKRTAEEGAQRASCVGEWANLRSHLSQMENPLNRVKAFLITFDAMVSRGPSETLSEEQCVALSYLAQDAIETFDALKSRWSSSYEAACELGGKQ